jgi:hypothetical protein
MWPYGPGLPSVSRSLSVSWRRPFIHSGLSPAFVLQPFEMIGEEVLQTLTSALVPVTPPDTPVFMPVQSLAPFYALRSASLSTSAAAHA